MRGAHLIVTLGVIGLPPLLATPARACGAVVQPVGGTIGQEAQRALIVVSGDHTDVVLQVTVPRTGGGYGLLVPAPVEPRLDTKPIDTFPLDYLELSTRPSIRTEPEPSGGGGCLFASAAGLDDGKGVLVGQEAKIGPLTAVTLSADTGAALTDWLARNGYAVPSTAQRVIDGYAGPGRWFMALKRNEDLGTGAPSSIGVRYTLAGDRRGYALRMAAIGAAERVGFTIFVAAPVAVAPAAPYAALTLKDLDRAMLRGPGYRAAVEAAVAAQGSRAFVLEGVDDAYNVIRGQLTDMVPLSHKVTRLSTVVPASSLTEDVAFTAAAPAEVPSFLDASHDPGGCAAAGGAGAFAGFLPILVALLLVRRRRAA